METVEVAIKSGWLSKINWTQAIALLASVLVVFGIDLDVHTQLALVAGIQGAQSVVTWLLKQFAKPTVTPSQAAKA